MKEFKPFEKVLVRGEEVGTWWPQLYSNAVEGGHSTVNGTFCRDDNIVSYEDNKHLLGTTDEPKPKRWRAKKGDTYYTIYAGGRVVEALTDYYGADDNKFYEFGAYFKTKEKAEEVAAEVKKLLLSK